MARAAKGVRAASGKTRKTESRPRFAAGARKTPHFTHFDAAGQAHMGFVQLVIVAAVLGLRSLFYRGPVVGGKG